MDCDDLLRMLSRRRATASAEYRPCLNAFLLPFGAPGTDRRAGGLPPLSNLSVNPGARQTRRSDQMHSLGGPNPDCPNGL